MVDWYARNSGTMVGYLVDRALTREGKPWNQVKILVTGFLFLSSVVPEQHFVGSSIEESHVSGSSSCISTNSSFRIVANSFCGRGMTPWPR